MKNKFLLLCFFFSVYCLHAQDSLRSHRNEVGLDATGFLYQFVHLNVSQNSSDYAPKWIITYRFHFKKGNIRSGIIGSYQSHKYNSYVTGDTHKYEYIQYDLKFRVGYEWISEISKHWQVYYGVDVLPGISYLKDDAPYFNGSYADGTITKVKTETIAPLLGLRYRLNKRMSLLAESSLSFNYAKTLQRRYYIPTLSIYPPLATQAWAYNEYYTQFNQPISLFLTIDL